MGDDGAVGLDNARLDDDVVAPPDDAAAADNDNAAVNDDNDDDGGGGRRRRHRFGSDELHRDCRGGCCNGPVPLGGLLRVEYLNNLFYKILLVFIFFMFFLGIYVV